MGNLMKKFIILLIVLIATVVLISCNTQQTTPEVGEDSQGTLLSLWKTAELKDISTQKTFKISDLNKPVILESFAVWCPTCTRQQNIIKELHEELGDSFVSVSLDTDPNEDESRVKTHIEQNGFDWIYAISPKEVTQSLIDDFGIGIVNAPGAPMVMICKNGSSKFLSRGVKSMDKIKEELNKC